MKVTLDTNVLVSAFTARGLSADEFRLVIAGGAEVLVTGDRDLLDVAMQLPELKVLSPRQFWEDLRMRGGGTAAW